MYRLCTKDEVIDMSFLQAYYRSWSMPAAEDARPVFTVAEQRGVET